MNIQPPKLSQRRMYIDGISVIKPSRHSLPPAVKQASMHEAILADRVIRISNRSYTQTTQTWYDSALHVLTQLYGMLNQYAGVILDKVEPYARPARRYVAGVKYAVMHKNWHSFVPSAYKKYSMSHGVEIKGVFKGYGTTFMAAAVLLLGITFWPQQSDATKSGSVAKDVTALTNHTLQSSKLNSSDKVASVVPSTSQSKPSPVTVPTYYVADPSPASSDVIAQEPLPPAPVIEVPNPVVASVPSTDAATPPTTDVPTPPAADTTPPAAPPATPASADSTSSPTTTPTAPPPNESASAAPLPTTGPAHGSTAPAHPTTSTPSTSTPGPSTTTPSTSASAAH